MPLFFSVLGVISAEGAEKTYMKKNLQVVVELSAEEIAPSDFLTFTIRASVSPDERIIFPEIHTFSDLTEEQENSGYHSFSVFHFEDSVPALTMDGKLMQIRKIVFAPDVAGKYIVPGFEVHAVGPGGETSLEIDPVEIAVVSTLQVADDAKLAIKPILLSPEKNSDGKFGVYGIILLVIIAVIAAALKMNKKVVERDEMEEIQDEFQRVRSLPPAEAVSSLEGVIVSYFKLKYHITVPIAGSNALIHELEIHGVASMELDSLRKLFAHYNLIRFSKEKISSETVERVCAEFADIMDN